MKKSGHSLGPRRSTGNPFAAHTRQGQLRCTICWHVFEGWDRALKTVTHYLEECHGDLLDPEIRRFVYFVLGRIELRMNQRKMLELAYARRRFFSIGSKPDSISLHSLRRRRFMTLSGHEGAPLLERYWHITHLGELVYLAYMAREREIEGRERGPDDHGLITDWRAA
jgi:hypothetical protein